MTRTTQPTWRSSEGVRLPDFLLIGAMKGGTTTLFRWLESHPGTALPSVKEPHFFSREPVYARGPRWYGAHFATAGHRLTGEASASYTDPEVVDVVAARIAALLPDVRLVFVARHPEARLRSHYVHEVQRRRERRPFRLAVEQPDSPYVARSGYAQCLGPFLERFARDRLLVLTTELLDPFGWQQVLAHLGLDAVPCPGENYNASATKPVFSAPVAALWERGYVRHVSRLPTPVRRLGKAVFLRGSAGADELIRQAAQEPLPERVREVLWADAARLQHLLDRAVPLWPEPPDLNRR